MNIISGMSTITNTVTLFTINTIVATITKVIIVTSGTTATFLH